MRKTMKRILCVLSAVLLLAAFPGVPYVSATESTTLVISSSQVMEIDEVNRSQVNYYRDATKTVKTGSVLVKAANAPDPLMPTMAEDSVVYSIGQGDATYVVVELSPNGSSDYKTPASYKFGQNEMPLSASSIILTLTSGIENTLHFDFMENNGGNPPGPGDDDNPIPINTYPIVAEFDVPGASPMVVQQHEEGYFVVPEGWTSGQVCFKASVFTQSDGTVEPFHGQQGDGIKSDIDLMIEGIANTEEIRNTVIASADRKSVTIQEGFSEYGKLQLHLISEPASAASVNQLISVIHRNYIGVVAQAPIPLSQSFGSPARNQALITGDAVKDIEVFYGNTEVMLTVNGLTVDKITDVAGNALQSVSLNSDGSATVVLPDLSTQSTTPVQITIKKTDGSSITRCINIVRAAIRLIHSFSNEKDAVFAGYEINKGYLYNNQPHNDATFDAYLQVILYKDNLVAGYRQIKIDDGEIVNSLQNDESGCMEVYSDHAIAIYGEAAGTYIEGANRISVFLTNGPVDFNSTTMPSVEFGTGSGVTVQFGGDRID